MRTTRSERGDVLITVAVLLMALAFMLALTIDGAIGYAQQRKMQNAADAAALAGAYVLAAQGTDAEIWAALDQYARIQNGAGSVSGAYLPDRQKVGNGARPSNVSGVEVTVQGSTPTFFAGLFGVSQITASGYSSGGYTPLDIVLVIDRSSSMDQSDQHGGSTKLDDAKAAAQSFVDLNSDTLSRLSLVTFYTGVDPIVPLSSNLRGVWAAIGNITAASCGSSCTNSAAGLQSAMNELVQNGRLRAVKFIIFLTDGQANLPTNQTTAESAALAVAAAGPVRGVVIDTIGLGSGVNASFLQQVATLTGGEYFFAPDSSRLQDIYATIYERIRLRLVQ